MSEIQNTNDKTVYILDSYGLIYRAYFALINHPLTNKNGENISAVVIFFRNLKALISKYKPQYLFAAFDSKTPTFRHKLYSEYKANRFKTPDDLHAQIPWIENILTEFGIPVLRVDGFEADDIIATVAKKCKEENRECRILSGDKDLLQLVCDSCKEMTPNKENGGWDINGVQEVLEKWGVGPEKILDYLSLVGDSADNVPGVKGVGDKTALKLLNEYGTLDGIYEHASEIKGALGEKIRNDKENAYFSKKLIELVDNVPLEIDFESLCTKNLHWHNAATMLSEYGAFQVAKSFSNENDSSSDSQEYKNELPQVKQKNQKIQEEETFRELKQNQGNYSPCTKLIELETFIDSVLNSPDKKIAFDTETDGLDVKKAKLVGFSLCNKKGEAIYVPVILPGEMFAPTTISKKDCLSQLERIFTNSQCSVIMHNGKFDLEILLNNGMNQNITCQIIDTMVAAWLLDPNATGKSPYSLEYLGEKFLGLKGIEFNQIVPKGKTFADLELEIAYPYGAEDADFTWQLWECFETKLKDANLNEIFFEMEMKILPILVSMEMEGIHLDKSVLNDFGQELKEQIKAKEEEIYKEVGHEFNIASTKQLQTVLFEERKLPAGKKTKTGYSTDTAVLEELLEKTDDILPQLILDYRSGTKLLNTYVETLPLLLDEKNLIHTSFLQTGTATGRLSSRDPNLQNIPIKDENGRKIRQAFTSQKGYVFISADYAQIELVILAHLSGDKNLSKAFIDGMDVHRSTASLIYGISPEKVTAFQRRFAKTVNFGVMYGMSAFRLAKELNISRTEAKNFIDQYFNTYSGVRDFISNTIKSATEDGFVTTITGRKRFVPELQNSNKLIQQSGQRIAINSPIQGSAADIVKKAMISIHEELKNQNLDAKMLLQVHDELIFQCLDDENVIEKVISIIKEKMESAINLNVPLRVSIESGKSWGQFH